jgi:hypothetical protein
MIGSTPTNLIYRAPDATHIHAIHADVNREYCNPAIPERMRALMGHAMDRRPYQRFCFRRISRRGHVLAEKSSD